MRVIPQFCFAQQGKIPSTFNSVSPSQAQVLKLGAGGWIRDFGIVLSDNTMSIQTDTYGGYVFSPNVPSGGNAGGTGLWNQFITKTSIPSGDPAQSVLARSLWNGALGVYAQAVAPSNTKIMYMVWLGYVYKSTNQGVTWINTNASFTPLTRPSPINNGLADPNQTGGPGIGDATYGPRIAIDPNNPSICYIGFLGLSGYGGPWYTQDGGVTWTQVSTSNVAAPSTAGYSYGLVYSHGSSTILYCFANGVGCYVTTNANNATPTWTKISGSGTANTTLTAFRRMFCDSTGRLWATDDLGTNNNLWVYSGGGTGGTWTHVTSIASVSNAQDLHAIAEDPTVASAQRIVVLDALADVYQSLDGGTTWSGGAGANNPTGIGNITSTDIPYLGEAGSNPLNTVFSGYTIGNAAFDSTGLLWWSSGVGMFNVILPNPLVATPFTWVDKSAGIEQLVAVQVTASPSGNVFAAAWDRGLIPLQLASRKYALNYYPPGVLAIEPGFALDWAGSTTCVAMQAYGGNGSFYVSTDGGLSFVNKTNGPSSGIQGVSVCATSSTNFLGMSLDGNLSYTTDASANWNDLGSYFNSTFGIPPGSMQVGIQQGASDVTLAAERSTTNTAYALVNLSGASGGGIYKTTNGGAAWALQSAVDGSGGLTSAFLELGGRFVLRSIYGFPSGLICFQSDVNQNAHPYTAASNFQISSDGGAHWNDFSSNVRDVWGADSTLTVGVHPRIYIWGWVNIAGTWTPGIYSTDDLGSTFTLVCQQEMWGTLDLVTWLEASKINANEFYTSYQGSGHARYGIS